MFRLLLHQNEKEENEHKCENLGPFRKGTCSVKSCEENVVFKNIPP